MIFTKLKIKNMKVQSHLMEVNFYLNYNEKKIKISYDESKKNCVFHMKEIIG